MKNQHRGGDCLKRGACTVCQFKGTWQERGGGGVDTPMHTMFALWPFYQPEKSKFWKYKTNPGYIIILHMCTTNGNHLMYASWDMEFDKNFTHLTTPKIKCLEILSFYTCAT